MSSAFDAIAYCRSINLDPDVLVRGWIRHEGELVMYVQARWKWYLGAKP